MPPSTPRLVVPIDLKKKPWEQTLPLHNRWHPEIPPVAEVKDGEFSRVEMVYRTGGSIEDDDSALDVKTVDLSAVHYLSGLIRVMDKEGIPAKPGDLLKVEICNLGPLPGDEWDFTATFDRENGGCYLTDHFPSATKAIWYCEGIYAYSPHIPGEIIRGRMEYLTPMGPTPFHVNPIFNIGPVEPRFSEWLVFEGISVDKGGRQHYLDPTIAYRLAVLNAIDYLSKFGYSKE
ncbi:hypothetical protein GH714_015559 [Hevea brasiliensis]|uniref:Formamidase n=1 Tax=Hevea brasiliensis TaxID=3981 RepID=A0A6A6L045_HEVBR|nr:hypothetical protein GH714_015559 [Hevea brasiliensis]